MPHMYWFIHNFQRPQPYDFPQWPSIYLRLNKFTSGERVGTVDGSEIRRENPPGMQQKPNVNNGR